MYNIAIVGCGARSNIWIKIAKEREDCNIVALVDIAKYMAEAKAKENNLDANIYTNLSDALEKETINLVFDITPPEHHYSTVCTALKAGCDVFGEKPMSNSLEDAYKMVELAEKMKKEYFIMQNRRYIPELYGFKSFLQSNELGHVGQLSASFQRNPHFGGFRDQMDSPLITDMAIHTFDAARFILAKKPVSVYCKEFNPSWSWYKGNANAVCIFEMEDGAIFDYRGSWCANGLNTSWESEWRASCSYGSAFWNGADEIYYDLELSSYNKAGVRSNEPIQTLTRNIINPVKIKEIGHLGCITEMFDSLIHGTKPQTDCRDNIKSIEMVYKAIESSKTNKVVLI